MQLGQILGIETVKDTQRLVENMLYQTWQEQFTSRDMRILATAMLVILIVIFMQGFHYLTDRAHRVKHKLWKLLLILGFNVALFVAVVVGQFYISNFFMRVRSPRAVQYSRAVPQIFSLTYQTYDPQYSIIVWGYDPNHLDYTELGGAAKSKTRRHDFNLAVEPKQTVYFQILVGDELYGMQSKVSGEPYQVKAEGISE